MKNDYLVINPKKIDKINKYWHLLTTNRHCHSVFWFLTGLMFVLGDTKLVLATGVAVGVMLTFYQSDKIDWQIYLFKLSQFLSGINRKLVLAVGGGGLVAIACYLILTIWSELENHWLATALILQGLMTTTGFSLVAWFLWKKQDYFSSTSSINRFDNLVINLTATSSFKRLFSINQLIELWEKDELTLKQIKQMEDYFHLMAKAETDPIILNKIEDTLFKFSSESKKSLNLNQPLNIPSQSKQTQPFTAKCQAKIDKIRA